MTERVKERGVPDKRLRLEVLRALPERGYLGLGTTFEWRTLAPAWPRKGDSIQNFGWVRQA